MSVKGITSQRGFVRIPPPRLLCACGWFKISIIYIGGGREWRRQRLFSSKTMKCFKNYDQGCSMPADLSYLLPPSEKGHLNYCVTNQTVLVTLLKMQPHYSQSSCENAAAHPYWPVTKKYPPPRVLIEPFPD